MIISATEICTRTIGTYVRQWTVYTVNQRPTTAAPDGVYKVIGSDGCYYGHWYVGKAWDNTKFVSRACSQDGIPYK